MKFNFQKIFFLFATLLLICNVAVWQAVYENGQRNEMTVAFFDVGQGDSVFIEAPNGNQILIDAGPNAKVLQELGSIMPWYDKSIDMIIVTNPDKDHIAGFVDVFKRFSVQYAVHPGTENKTLVHTTLQGLIVEKGLEKLVARRGMKIVLDDEKGIILTVLYPDTDVSNLSSNDGSIVMLLSYGKTEVMLTGDAPESVERHLLTFAETALQSDILKVGHHGSKTSTHDAFVAALSPEYAVISSGRGNKYGHPTEEVLDLLKRSNVKVLRTDELGTIVMKSDGERFKILSQI